MVNVVYNQLKDNIREREKVDKPLINWFLLTFILSWLTFGIAFVYVFIKRIIRVDKYIRRKHEFFDMVIHFIELESNERGLDKYEEYMSSLRGRLSRFQKEVHPVMPFVIKGFLPVIIFTLFIAGYILTTGINNISNTLLITIFLIWGIDTAVVVLIYIYKMNRIWDDVQQFESEMYETISHIFMSLKLKDHPLIYCTNPHIKKNFTLYVVLGFLTCGIWFIVWDYYVHTAPDKMYQVFHKAEDDTIEVVKSCCKRDE